MVGKYVFRSVWQTQGEKLQWLECGLSKSLIDNDRNRDKDTDTETYIYILISDNIIVLLLLFFYSDYYELNYSYC